MARRGAYVATVLVLLATATSLEGAAYAEPLVTRVWRLERVVRDAPTIATVNVQVEEDERGAWGALVPVRLDRGGSVVATFGGFIGEDDPAVEPVAYQDATTVGCRPGASPGSSCTVTRSLGAASFSYVIKTDASNTVNAAYVVASGIAPRLTLASGRDLTHGWRVRPVALPARRAVSRGVAGGNAGVAAGGTTVESFSSASTTGGRRGSIAVATPPCRPAHRVGALREGHGEATLTGGTRSVTARCATDVYDVTSFARRATTWRLSGSVVGVGYGPTRIVVIDL